MKYPVPESKSSAFRWPLAAGRTRLAAGRFPHSAGRFPHSAGRWPLSAFRWPLSALGCPRTLNAEPRTPQPGLRGSVPCGAGLSPARVGLSPARARLADHVSAPGVRPTRPDRHARVCPRHAWHGSEGVCPRSRITPERPGAKGAAPRALRAPREIRPLAACRWPLSAFRWPLSALGWPPTMNAEPRTPQPGLRGSVLGGAGLSSAGLL